MRASHLISSISYLFTAATAAEYSHVSDAQLYPHAPDFAYQELIILTTTLLARDPIQLGNCSDIFNPSTLQTEVDRQQHHNTTFGIGGLYEGKAEMQREDIAESSTSLEASATRSSSTVLATIVPLKPTASSTASSSLEATTGGNKSERAWEAAMDSSSLHSSPAASTAPSEASTSPVDSATAKVSVAGKGERTLIWMGVAIAAVAAFMASC